MEETCSAVGMIVHKNHIQSRKRVLARLSQVRFFVPRKEILMFGNPEPS